MSGPYLMSPCKSSILCGRQNRLEDDSRFSAYRFICFFPRPALYRCLCIVDCFRTPGAAHPSSSRIFMIWRTLRFGTSRFSCTACSMTSPKLSGSLCTLFFVRPIGRRPSKPLLRYFSSYRYKLLFDLPFFSAAFSLICRFFPSSRSASSSGAIIWYRLSASSSCHFFTSFFSCIRISSFRKQAYTNARRTANKTRCIFRLPADAALCVLLNYI